MKDSILQDENYKKELKLLLFDGEEGNAFESDLRQQLEKQREELELLRSKKNEKSETNETEETPTKGRSRKRYAMYIPKQQDESENTSASEIETTEKANVMQPASSLDERVSNNFDKSMKSRFRRRSFDGTKKHYHSADEGTVDLPKQEPISATNLNNEINAQERLKFSYSSTDITSTHCPQCNRTLTGSICSFCTNAPASPKASQDFRSVLAKFREREQRAKEEEKMSTKLKTRSLRLTDSRSIFSNLTN